MDNIYLAICYMKYHSVKRHFGVQQSYSEIIEGDKMNLHRKVASKKIRKLSTQVFTRDTSNKLITSSHNAAIKKKRFFTEPYGLNNQRGSCKVAKSHTHKISEWETW